MNQGIPSPEERAANSRELNKLHVGNRFRLMFGMPLLPERTMTDQEKAQALLDRAYRVISFNAVDVLQKIVSGEECDADEMTLFRSLQLEFAKYLK